MRHHDAQGRRPLGAAPAGRASRPRILGWPAIEHLFAACGRIRTILIVALFAGPLTAAAARADCSYDTQMHLSMAVDFYREWATYSGETTADSADLAKAEWQNFAHEMDWLNNYGDFQGCNDRKIDLTYSLYSARRDQVDALKAESPALLKVILDAYYANVSELFSEGYANVNPSDYAALKQDVKNWFAKEHRPFKSWEKP